MHLADGKVMIRLIDSTIKTLMEINNYIGKKSTCLCRETLFPYAEQNILVWITLLDTIDRTFFYLNANY